MSYEDGKPVEPSTDPVVKGCVVALDAITIPTDNPVLAETAHRIVGRSRVNNDPEIIDEVYNPRHTGMNMYGRARSSRELPRRQLCRR